MTLLDLQDKVHRIRCYVECAYMACDHLNNDDAGPLQTVLDTASEQLSALDAEIKAMRSKPLDE